MREVSPLPAQRGQRVSAKIKDRCSCPKDNRGRANAMIGFSVTCPVHGDGRPAGTGK